MDVRITTNSIWNLYHEDVKRFILSKVKNEMIADDILQDAFIKIHNKLQTLKDETKLKSWVFAIARYTLLDYFRNAKKSMETSIDFEVNFEDSEIYNLHTEKDCLHGILKNLPRKYSEPLFLSDIIGLKHKQVAEKLNVSLTTVKSQILRARKKVTQGFMDCCDFKMNTEGFLVGEIKEKVNCKVCS